jgi:hypothetical protein
MGTSDEGASASFARVCRIRYYYQVKLFSECSKRRMLPNHPKSIRTSARMSISHTTTRLRNVILKVASSNNHIWRLSAPVCLNTRFQHVLLKMVIQEVQGQIREERHSGSKKIVMRLEIKFEIRF